MRFARYIQTKAVVFVLSVFLCSFAAGNVLSQEKIIFHSNRTGKMQLFVMDSDGSNLTRLINTTYNDFGGSWSPDGSRIAFASDRDGNFATANDIYVMDADGSNPTRLTINSANDYLPSWSPDGTKIVYVSTYQNPGGYIDIFIMNSDGTNQVNLTNTLNDNFSPSFSPDGSRIIFESRHTGNNELYTMNTDGSTQINITNSPGEDRGGAWSPDGSRIAFYSERDGNPEIYVMNADGSNQTRLTNNTAVDVNACWSSDGTQIAFASNRDGNYEIYVMNADGSNQTNITNDPGNDYNPSWKINNNNNRSINLTTHNGNSAHTGGNVTEINWSYMNLELIKIEFSSDGGETWDIIADNYSAYTEKYLWVVPVINSSECLIKISDQVDSEVFDISDDYFTIFAYFYPEMISIPSGNIQIGYNDGYSSEKPVHNVQIDDFSLSLSEVTQQQYLHIVGSRPGDTIPGETPYYENNPIVNVSWFDAAKFCNLLSEYQSLEQCYDESTWKCDFTKNGYRLPTEAEWEYACRAGTSTLFNTGNTESNLNQAAWYYSNSNAETHIVSQKEPNAWGLYDMHGNVWEWVNDWYSDTYYAISPEINPTGPETGTQRSIRGGAFEGIFDHYRYSFRSYASPDAFAENTGFRVARGSFSTSDNIEDYGTQLTFSGKEKKWGTDWSPDGNWISYSEKGNDGFFNIWIVPSLGDEPVNLTENIEGSHSIAYFTPNENKLIFNARGADESEINNYKIHRINYINTNENEVILNKAQNASISNDGKYIAYRAVPSIDLNIWNMETDNTISIGTEEDIGYPIQIFSHDDSHIITQKLINEVVKLVQIPVDGGQFEQLTSIAGDHWYQDMSSNGNFILFTELQQNKIWVYNTVSGESSELFPESPFKLQGGSFSTDGSKIAYFRENAVGSGIYEVFVVDFPFGMLNVLNPNGGETLEPGKQHNITWTSSNVNSVNIVFSVTGGNTWETVQANVPASQGSFTWTVPNVSSNECLIKIVNALDEIASDTSDNTFEISTVKSITVTTPNNGEKWPSNSTQTIKWSKRNIDYVNIEFSVDGGSSWETIATNILVNTYDWQVPGNTTSQGKIRVVDTADSNIWDESDGYFEILSIDYINIAAPAANDIWSANSTKEIVWGFGGDITNVKIELSLDDGSTWSEIADNVQAFTGSYQFTAPNTSSPDCRIRISDVSNPNTYKISGKFEIRLAELYLIHTPIEEADELEEMTFNVRVVSGAAEIESIRLFSRTPGETAFDDSVSMTLVNPDNKEYSYTKESGYFTAPGLEYYIVVIDDGGAEARAPVDEGFYSITANTNVLGIESPNTTAGGTAQNAYRMISVPINFTSTSINDQLEGNLPLGNYGNDWRLFRYSPGSTSPSEYPDIEGFSPGNAFWFITKNDYKLDTVGGMTVTTSSPFNITLKQGWNDIANPWLFDISWDDIENPSGAQLSSLYSYDGTWSDPTNPPTTMEPWKGYAVYSYSNVNIIIKLHSENGTGSAKPIAEDTKADWMLSIKASAGEARDISNHLGVRPGAKTEWDRYDHIEPHVIGDYVSVSFPHNDWEEYSHSYTVDFRPSANIIKWDFDVKTNISSEMVVVQLDGIDNLPDEYNVLIYDLDLKEIIDYTYGSFSFVSGTLQKNNRSERHFRLVVTNEEYTEPEEFISVPTEFLTARCYPNPFNPQTTIQYVLSEPDNVIISIFNSVGQQILRHNIGPKEPGTHNFIFDASEFTTGTYFYRIETGKSTVSGKMLYMK